MASVASQARYTASAKAKPAATGASASATASSPLVESHLDTSHSSEAMKAAKAQLDRQAMRSQRVLMCLSMLMLFSHFMPRPMVVVLVVALVVAVAIACMHFARLVRFRSGQRAVALEQGAA